MIRRAASFAVAASIGSVVGTITGTILGVALASIVMADKKTRDVVVNYHNANTPEDEGLRPQDATLDDVHLTAPLTD